MAQGHFKKSLNLLDLTLLGVGSMIGSGWLYAALNSAAYAGPLSWISWILAAVVIILIGLVYSELGAAIPRAGGFIRYPDYSHGSVVGFMIGFAAFLAYTSVTGVEVEAVRQYALYWWPALGHADGSPTVLGFAVQIALLVLFFLLNYWSVNVFGKFNTLLTLFKFVVPLLAIITLFTFFDPHNLSVPATAPGGVHGVFSAISGAGIVFSLLGFRQAVDFASEAKRPQRDVPLAIIYSVILSLAIYLLLQFAFLGSVPFHVLSTHGWSGLKGDHILTSPYADLAKMLGLAWLLNLILVDAVISPAGTGNIFLSGAARVLFAWARNGHLFNIFQKVDPRTGVPRAALWLALILSIAWTLPSQFQVWSGLISAVTSAFVLTYMVGSVSAAAFRRTAPDLPRPFRLKGLAVIGPLAFIAATFIAYWSGWSVNKLLVSLILLAWVGYLLFVRKSGRFGEDLRAGWWLVIYYVCLGLLSWLGTYGGRGLIPAPWDSILLVLMALVTYYWGVNSALETPRITEEHSEGQRF